MRDIMSDLENGIFFSDPDPTRRARKQMQTQKPKRFYKKVDVAPGEGGFSILLDGKPARTPGRVPLALPTEAAARLVADEFSAQSEEMDLVAMPVWRLVNTAIDGVAQAPNAVAEDILRFAASDLLLYRAEGPAALVDRQNAAWDPVLDWARAVLHGRFILAEGVMPVEQPREAVQAVRIHLAARTEPLRLAALHVMTTLLGSALLALAVEAGELTPDQAWTAAHVDEDWNAEQWGHDAEAVARRNARRRDMTAAARLIEALGPVSR
ncbi:MAG TPA: ATP12 family protein [Mesorhizobium sp.]|jgi:chaperone required for assembly of F1-ATPase|nr:ATP12 family protein [Mesorhizobium sp.]